MRVEAGTRIHLTLTLRMMGLHEEARAEALRAIALLPEGSLVRPYAFAVLARALEGLGDEQGGRDAAMKAMAELEALGGAETGEALVRLVHAEALDASGRRAEAHAAIAAARDRLLARAHKIENPDWRQSMLANVPEHARTLELAAAWTQGAAVSS